MPVQSWSSGQVLTAAQMTSVSNLLLYPTTLSGSLNPGVAGNLYVCTASLTLTLPSPASAGQMIGVKVRGTSLTITVNRNSSDVIYGPGMSGLTTLSMTSDGQLVVLISDGTNWQVVAEDGFNYPKAALISTAETTTSTSYVNLTTSGPVVTIATMTTALVTLSASLSNGTANDGALMGYGITGASSIIAADATALYLNNSSAITTSLQGSLMAYQTGLTSGINIFTAKFRANAGGTASFGARTLAVIPLPT